MKTRIISAAVMIAVVVAALTLGKTVNTIIITAFIALICAVGIYELLHNAAGIKNIPLTIISSLYGAAMIFLLDKNIAYGMGFPYTDAAYVSAKGITGYDLFLRAPLFLSIAYFIFGVFVVLYNHKDFSLDKIAVYTAFPLIISYGFACLNSIICENTGIYYLLLLVNFASICDTGAYFVGSFFGKRKLCPEISPKKTVEGAVGGIVSSMIVSVILVLSFGQSRILSTILLTIPLCIVGMLGDLFASSIKRSVGLKDYGNLIPGHGGILDRFDSMLLISPILYIFMELRVI